MDQHLNFVVSLRDNASRQAKQLAKNLGAFNNANYRTSIRLSLIDNVTSKLKAIRDMFASLLASIATFPSKVKIALKHFGDAISSIFKSDGSKQWFEKIVGYFKTGIKWATRFGDVLVGAFAGGGAAITAGIGAVSAILSKQLIKINSEMEQFEVSLQTTLGSLTAAKQEMAGIVQFAKETPYEIKNITDAVVKLRAYSMDSDKWLEPLGNAASAFGRDITDAVEMAADAVQGMFRRALSYGIKMEKEDFKRGGKYAGMTYSEALMGELQKRFKGGMELQAKTIKGIWSNVKDSLYISFAEATKPFFGVIKQQVQSLYDYLGSNEGQAKVKQLVSVMTDMLARMLEGGKKVYSFIKTTLVPIAQTTGKAMLEVFTAISDMVTPILTAIKPLAIAFASILNLLSWLVTQSKLALQIFVAFSAAIKIMGLLGLSVKKVATNMVATGKAANILSASIKTLGAGLIAAGVSFAAMWAIGNYLEIKNNLKEVGNEIYNMASGADQVKQKLKEIGEETGHTVKEMSKAALAAKQFGHNMANVINVAASTTSESQKGFGINLSVDADQAAEAIGRLAAAFIKENDTFEEMERKTREAGDMLVNLNRVADITGFTFDDMAIAIEDNREVLAEYGDNIGELTFLIAEFGKAAKQAGIDANVGQFLDVLGSLLHPTKEMLLSLPSSTWIAKPLKDMDIDAIAKSLSEALDAKDIKAALIRAEGTSTKLIDASQEIRDNIESGVDYAYDKMKETAALFSATGGGTGAAPGTGLGAGGKVSNFFGTGAGLAVEMAGIVVTAIIGGVLYKKIVNKISSYIDTNKFGLGNLSTKMTEKQLAKTLGKDFLPKLEKYQEAQIKSLEKTNKETIKVLEKALSKAQKSLDSLQLSLLKNPAIRKAIPFGMSAEEYVSDIMANEPEEIRKMSEKKLADFYKGQDALETKILDIEQRLAAARLQAAEGIENLIKKFDSLRDAVKKGRVPESLKDLAIEINNIGKVAKKTAKEVAGSYKLSRRMLAGGVVQGLDWKKSVGQLNAFFKNPNLNTFGQSAYATSRTVNNIKAAENPIKAYSRALQLSLGRISGRILGKVKGIFTGKGMGELPMYIKDLTSSLDEASKAATEYAYEMRKTALQRYNPATNPFAKYSKFMPTVIQQQLQDMGLKPTPEFESMMSKAVKRGVTLGLSEDSRAYYMRRQAKIYMPEVGAKALGTKASMNAYFHELGHALQPWKQFGEDLRTVWGRYNKDLKATLAIEKNAWLKAIEIYKSLKANIEFMGIEQQAKTALGSYIKDFLNRGKTSLAEVSEIVGEEPMRARNARGQFVRAGEWGAMDEAVDSFVKADKAASDLAKSISKLNKAIGTAFIVEIAGAIGEALLVPYLEKKALEDNIHAKRMLSLWEKAVRPILTTARVVGTSGMAASIVSEAMIARILGQSVIAALGKSGGPLALIAIAIGGLEKTFSDFASGGKKYGGYDTYKSGDKEYNLDTGEAWSAKSIAINAALQVGKLGQGFADAITDYIVNPLIGTVKFIGDNTIGRLSSLMAGGGGKLPKTEYFAGVYGQANIDRQKQIEDDFNKTKDIAARELAYTQLHEEKLALVTELSASKKEAVLTALQERIKQQYKITEDAGVASSQELMYEMARAAKYVEEKIGAMTPFAKSDFSKYITEFEEGGTLYGHALAVSIDEALANYDFSSSEGFKKFLQDMESGNVPQAFKEFFEGMDGGQLAMTLSIEQLRKMQKESDSLAIEIESLNDEIETVTTTIADLEESLKKLELETSTIIAVFDFHIARNELVLTSDKVYKLEDSIAALGKQLSKAEEELLPLENALQGVQNELQAVQNEISKTEEAIDRLMNGPIKGQKEYDLQMFDIDEEIRKKQYELKQIQNRNKIWDQNDLGDSDLAKRARIPETVLEEAIAALERRRDAMVKARDDYESTVKRARLENVDASTEVDPAEMAGLPALKEALKNQQAKEVSLKAEEASATAIRDAKLDEIEAIKTAKQLKEDELQNLKDQVEQSNLIWQRAKDRAIAEGEVAKAQAEITRLQEGMTGQALLQLAMSGAASPEQIKALSDNYVKLMGQTGDLTGQKTIKEFELPDLQKALAEKQEKQAELATKMETLVAAIDKMIQGVDISALSKTDLESLFGANIGTVINSMASNLYALALGEKKKAVDPAHATYEAIIAKDIAAAAAAAAAAATSHMIGHNALKSASGRVASSKALTWVAEDKPEAIIPLQNGSVPVTLLGGNQSQQPIVVENNFGDMTFIVRNDKDIEELKEAVIDLRTGDTTFWASPHQYV